MVMITVEEWKGLFSDVGLSEQDMEKWHRLFESKYPQAHQSFLEWLGLDEGKIKAIRGK